MRHNQRIDEYFNPSYVHKPVLWREIADLIDGSLKKGDGLLADCTLGEGGHSEILLQLFPQLNIIAFERDAEILGRAETRLSPFGGRISFVNSNFSEIYAGLAEGVRPDYIMYDFGISSYHFEGSGRGFTFASDEPLDMRLDGEGMDAAYVINTYPERELARIFRDYGEERWAVRIAKVIAERRTRKTIGTSAELASIVLGAIPRRFHVKNIHPATRVFQAVRIEVNGELDAIRSGIDSGFRLLAMEGVLMAISFHSLEDRIVKNYFRTLKDGCVCGNEPQNCVCTNEPFARILTKKPVEAGDDEVAWNARSRSAKLRVALKTGEPV